MEPTSLALAHGRLIAFVNDIADDECYESFGEGDYADARCRSCQARDILRAVEKAEGK